MANSRAALEEARSARTAVESLSTELRKPPSDTENHQRRTIILSILTVALMVLSVWLILLGAAGFSDPSPSPTFGNVGVAVETGEPPTDELGLPFEDVPTFGVAGYFDPDSNYVGYTVFFPDEFVGKRFALLLEDGAVLSEVRGGTPRAVACRESGGSGDTAFSIDHRCQIIYGTVPAQPSTDDLIRSLIAPESCGITGMPEQFTMASVHIEGTPESPLLDEIDWAHKNVTFTGLNSGVSNEALNRWNGVTLDRWYGTGLQQACKVSHIPLNTRVTDSDPSDVQLGHDSLSLFGDDALLTNSVVATERDIEMIATTLVAVGGALIGLAIGFVPVVYEAARAARRQRHST